MRFVFLMSALFIRMSTLIYSHDLRLDSVELVVLPHSPNDTEASPSLATSSDFFPDDDANGSCSDSENSLELDSISEETYMEELGEELKHLTQKNSIEKKAGVVLRETAPIGVGATAGFLGLKLLPLAIATPAAVPLVVGGIIAGIGYGVTRYTGGEFFEHLPQHLSSWKPLGTKPS